MDLNTVKYAIKMAINLLEKEAYYSIGYASYVLPLVFFKYLSDLYSEKSCEFSKSLGSFLAFSWSDLEAVSEGASNNVSDVFSQIETDNYFMEGIFINPSGNQWHRISDEALCKVIKIISIIEFSGIDADSCKNMGSILNELVLQPEYYRENTNSALIPPDSLKKLMIRILEPKMGESLFDPACGMGGFLLEALFYLKEQGSDPSKSLFFGQEESYIFRAYTIINLFLNGVFNPHILLGSTIKDVIKDETGEKCKFDVIVTNPPFGVKAWEGRHLSDENFPYGRPPKNSADYAFIQKSLASLSKTGRAAMIVPHGVLFRGGDEAKIRKNIVQDDVIEAIIGLPASLFDTTKIPTSIIVFAKAKTGERKRKILFIDASKNYELGRGKNHLSEENIREIVLTYSEFRDRPGYSKVVSAEEISLHDYILTISRYIEPSDVKSRLNSHELAQKVHSLEFERNDVQSKIDEILLGLGMRI
ncbi:hypothetical protein C7293_13360 [filamentous cyanobacterium CCT1]|nr:hypothetical protein C7293_13360 [filamentous cyanobacterium CCT1]PSN80312.1 hypothetical protein C8B47_07130 [filamentous cyanobacterium CCP4]